MTLYSHDQCNAEWPWHRLQGTVANDILHAPRLDPHTMDGTNVRYLLRVVKLAPWCHHLALVALVLTDYVQHEPGTVRKNLTALHHGLHHIFQQNGLKTMSDWLPREHIRQYMEDPKFTASLNTRQQFLNSYNVVTEYLWQYRASLAESEASLLLPYLLPLIPQGMYRRLSRQTEILATQRVRRKQASDAIVPFFTQIRSQAHLRWNAAHHLYQEYQKAVKHVETHQGSLPFSFSYEDPRFGMLHFTLWNRPTFILHHANQYAKDHLCEVRHPTKAEQVRYIVEYHDALSRPDIDPPFLWLRSHDARVHPSCKSQIVPMDAEIRRSRLPLNIPLIGREQGQFLASAQQRCQGLLLDLNAFFAGVTFGLVAVDFLTTTGARLHELMQISLTRDCLKSFTLDGEQRLLVMLVPKGHEQTMEYPVGLEMKRTLDKAVAMLQATTGLTTIPSVPFNASHPRAHRFPSRPYILQYQGQHLGCHRISDCIRFLCTGFDFVTADGEEIQIHPHLFRHAFAVQMRQKESSSLDLLAKLLHHRDQTTTAYYSEPTQQQVLEETDRLLASFTAHLGDFNDAMKRAPKALQHQIEEAQQRRGSLSHVLGGSCTFPLDCPVAVACLGCPMKVPDPNHRDEILEARLIAEKRRDEATKIGLRIEANKQQRIIQWCDQDLGEMDRIEAYRRDESRQLPLLTMQTGKVKKS